MEKSTIQVEELDESDDFLLELAAIEAEAEAAAKRPKVAAVPEGPYMAALKGSKSEQWQLNPLNPASKSRGGFQGASVNSNPAGSYGSEAGEQDYPEKNCPCGNGVCSILTSNTQKNPGRKFYKCPNREENGGCGFFQWCDAVHSSGTQPGSYGNTNESNFPDLQCPCGAGMSRVLTAKTGENIGRQFYRCPVFEGSCGFFKWCNDDAVQSPSFTKSSNLSESDNRGYQTAKTGSGTPCYKCGKEGHWARDCTAQSGNPPYETGPVQPSSTAGQCYKCGKEGHWARDCTAQSGIPSYETGPAKPSSAAGECYKCGKEGHWARDCTAQSGNLKFGSEQVKFSSSGGECYKCGKQGHWARDCTGQSGNQQFQSPGQGKSATSGGECYKCGKPGHWARDCTEAVQSTGVPGKRQRQY
ncbi:hypothetical protein DY000_02017345 [Brassica cretica]|uniref:Uncharacterized protein n=1 Tax=Brassica cretica TaxID=69181 RepID=A0ABQ7DBC5_BRACR|nr:hypothetical protein DY000_02017345 [Brassica cretica]